MDTETIPADGTKAAVRYWATRTREALREADAAAKDGDWHSARAWATDAAGCGGQYETAMAALADTEEI